MAIKATVTFVGHSTIHIEMDGVRLLTDPLLGKIVGHLRRQVPTPDPALLDVDAVLISHLHGDHLDLASLRIIGQNVPLIVPHGAGPFLKIRRFKKVDEIKAGETIDVGGVKVMATRADHEGKRLPWSQFVQPVGYILDGSSEIYFAGDTDLFPEMSDIGDDLELALLPVWGWGPNLGKGHMDPTRAAEALVHLRPKIAVPIHWGTYSPIIVDWFKPKFLTQPPEEFAKQAANITPEVAIRIIKPGESMQISDSKEPRG